MYFDNLPLTWHDLNQTQLTYLFKYQLACHEDLYFKEHCNVIVHRRKHFSSELTLPLPINVVTFNTLVRCTHARNVLFRITIRVNDSTKWIDVNVNTLFDEKNRQFKLFNLGYEVNEIIGTAYALYRHYLNSEDFFDTNFPYYVKYDRQIVAMHEDLINHQVY